MYLCESSTGWSFHCCGVQSVEAKSESASGIWLSATLWTVACRAFLPMGFSREEYWSGLPFPPPGLLPDPGVEPRSPALAGRFFTVWATREAWPLWSLSELHFGLSGGVFLGPRRFTSVPAHIHIHSLSRSQGEQMLSSYLFSLLWYQLNCLFISSSLLLFCQFLLSWLLFGWWGKLLTLRLLETLPLSVLSRSCLPHLPTSNHGPWSIWNWVTAVHF